MDIDEFKAKWGNAGASICMRAAANEIKADHPELARIVIELASDLADAFTGQ